MNVLRLEFINNCNLNSMYEDSSNYKDDSGFDVYCPKNITVPAKSISFKIHLGIKCEFYTEDKDGYKKGKPFMLFPRSSMGSKTPLRLSNSIGLIDSNYRGELIAIVDNVSDKDYKIMSGNRLVQIVNFEGSGIDKLVFGDVSETERGECGLGSTGQ